MHMTEEQLYKLNLYLLLEIRILSARSDLKIHRLVDCLHNLPVQLYALSKGEVSTEEIENELRENLESQGLGEWLERRLKHL